MHGAIQVFSIFRILGHKSLSLIPHYLKYPLQLSTAFHHDKQDAYYYKYYNATINWCLIEWSTGKNGSSEWKASSHGSLADVSNWSRTWIGGDHCGHIQRTGNGCNRQSGH